VSFPFAGTGQAAQAQPAILHKIHPPLFRPLAALGGYH
jgi:hypothetical protein